MNLLTKFFRIVCMLACCTVLFPSLSSARETRFDASGSLLSLNSYKNRAAFEIDGEGLQFYVQKDGMLKLMSLDGSSDYLSFRSYDGDSSNLDYCVKAVSSDFPPKTFFEITAAKGAHGQNFGFWLIGKKDGRWVTYVSIDSLTAMGYTPGEWHLITTDINKDGTGRYILSSIHKYLPPGARYSYEAKTVTDLKVQLFWDKNAGWFGLRSI